MKTIPVGKIAFNIALISYLAGSVGYFVYLVYRKQLVSTLATIAVVVGLLSHSVLMGVRSSVTGHGPYTSTFEVALFAAWVIVLVYFLIEWKYKIKNLGAFVIPLVFLILFFAAFMSKDSGLAVESGSQFWLTMHRALSILGYAAFSIAFVAAIMYLIQEHQVKSKKLGIMYFRMPSLEVLDDLNHKVITIGFPLFTIGFITGVIWSVKTNLSFLGEISKTWPLMVVWGIYGLIFFGRLMVGMRGKRAALGSIVGFFSVILTYFMHV